MAMEPNIYREFIATLLDEVRAGACLDRRASTTPFAGSSPRSSSSGSSSTRSSTAATSTRSAPRRTTHSPGERRRRRRCCSRTASTRSRCAVAKDVYVAGSNADNIGNQAGGWTLTWQGGSTNVIPGTTILDGIRELARGNVTHSEDASAPVPRRAAGIVVVGETPYAEGFGDVFGPRWSGDPGDHGVPRPVKDMQSRPPTRPAIDTVCAAAKRCAGGRRLRPAADHRPGAAAARSTRSWRRGCPAAKGPAWRTRCSAIRPFTGRLPMTWPRSLDQEPINIGDADYDPLFPYGYGLRTR